MGNNELASRRVIAMPRNAPDLRGQQRDAAMKSEALVLREAICGALDILDLFQHEGGIVLVAKGELQVVNNDLLRWLIEATFVEKHVIRTLPGPRYEVEYQLVRPSESAVRTLLTREASEGGLRAKLPVLQIEEPQLMVPPAAAPTAPGLPDDHPEAVAGRRTLARYADADKKRELEMRRGAERVAYFEGRQVKAETPAAEESIPAYAPAEAKDGTKDPASPA
jgi:hypothetical protein